MDLTHFLSLKQDWKGYIFSTQNYQRLPLKLLSLLTNRNYGVKSSKNFPCEGFMG